MYILQAIIFVFVTIFSLSSSRPADTMSTPPQCDPNTIEQAPYQLQKVCAALATINRLSDAMETYLEESSPSRQVQYLRGAPDERFDNSVKRQDLDHVFLRFGRRRR